MDEIARKLGQSNILGIKKPFLINKLLQYKPHTYIEVGVFNCETFFSVVDLFNNPIDSFIGFDLFRDPEDSKEEAPLDTRYITYADAVHIARTKGKSIALVQGDTKDTLLQTLLESSHFLHPPVFVFLDGGHSFETAYGDILSVYNGLCTLSPVCVWIDDSNFQGVNKAIRSFTSDIIREEYNCTVERQLYDITEIHW